jgi:hypothetical protein
MDQGPTVPFNATNWSKTLSGSLHNCAEGIRRPEKSQQQGSTKNSQFEATPAASIKLSIQGQIMAARNEASLAWRTKRLERCSSWFLSQHPVPQQSRLAGHHWPNARLGKPKRGRFPRMNSDPSLRMGLHRPPEALQSDFKSRTSPECIDWILAGGCSRRAQEETSGP